MIRKGFLVATLAALFSLPTLAKAEVVNPWEVTLGGGAANTNDFEGFSANLNGSIGYYFTDTLEGSVRQTVTYSDFADTFWSGSTRVALDLHFPLGDRGQFVPFVGANVGYVYGDANDTWLAAPEAGIKVYVNETTFVFLIAEYQFFFEDAGDADDTFDDGQFVYTVGIGFRF